MKPSLKPKPNQNHPRGHQGGGQPPDAPGEVEAMKGQEDNSQGTNKTFVHVAKLLYGLGFNVIPVDGNKRPIIDSWSSDSRLPWGELERRLGKAKGLAITGRYFNSEDYDVVILDLDDVDVAFEVLGKVFGEQWQARLCGQTWSFCGLTGPRPKGKVKCDCETPDQDCECVNTETGERRKLSELQRGMYIVVRAPKRCLPGGSVRSDAIEVMVSNYEVVYGRHPSGAYYQPVRFANGKWTPIGIEDVDQGEVIKCDELRALIALLRQSPTNALEGLDGEDAETTAELNLPEPTKELGEDDINKLIELIRPIWRLESDEGKHYHNSILYGLSSLMRRAGIKHESARKVIEAAISAGLQDAAGEADQAALQALARNEQRHLRETVDYIYGKPTKLWGKRAFERNLGPVVERAASQGIISVSRDEWFTAIYTAIFGRHWKEGEDKSLDDYLPREKEPIDVPAWAMDMAIPSLKFCLSVPRCTDSIIAHTREDSQYALIAKSVYAKKDGVEIDYFPIALLPKYMAQVYDEFYGQWTFVALLDGKVIASSTDFDEFIETLRRDAGNRFYVTGHEKYLDVVKSRLPMVRRVVSPGLTDEGLVDPYGVIDVADYGVEPLLRAYEWIRKYYPETNARWAWFNVVAVAAKALTPLIRRNNKTFNDTIVYNVGRGGEGKSTLVTYVLLPLLGGEDAGEHYSIAIRGSVRTEPQLRNLLGLNRLPLILDEQKRESLEGNTGIFLSAVVGSGTIGVHAARYGQGIAVKFKNLRGMVVFTNVPFLAFLRDVMNAASDFAVARRFIEISWDFDPIKSNAFSDPPQLKPIYGFAGRLWQKYRGELTRPADLLELIETLATAIGREYPGDSRVSEMLQYTLEIVKELKEMKRNERQSLTDADALINRAYEFLSSELKVSQLTAIKALRYILENPSRAGVKLTVPRRESLDKLEVELGEAISKYLVQPYGIEEQVSDMDDSQVKVVGKDPDAIDLYALLKNARSKGKVLAVLYAKSPLIPGTPREFLGSQKNTYSAGKAKRFGYAIPLAKLVRVFLGGGEEEPAGPAGEPSGDGEFHGALQL